MICPRFIWISSAAHGVYLQPCSCIRLCVDAMEWTLILLRGLFLLCVGGECGEKTLRQSSAALDNFRFTWNAWNNRLKKIVCFSFIVMFTWLIYSLVCVCRDYFSDTCVEVTEEPYECYKYKSKTRCLHGVYLTVRYQPAPPSCGLWRCWSGGSTRPEPGRPCSRGRPWSPWRRRSCRRSGCGWRCSTPLFRWGGWCSPRWRCSRRSRWRRAARGGGEEKEGTGRWEREWTGFL